MTYLVCGVFLTRFSFVQYCALLADRAVAVLCLALVCSVRADISSDGVFGIAFSRYNVINRFTHGPCEIHFIFSPSSPMVTRYVLVLPPGSLLVVWRPSFFFLFFFSMKQEPMGAGA